MRAKLFIFVFLFVFVCSAVFSATPYNSGSGSMGKPSVKFKEWQVGRSPKGMDTNSKEQKSFITSTEEVCYFTASVCYDGNQGDNVSPIDPSTVSWTVENPSHGMQLVESDKNWSGAKHPSKLDASTSFNFVGKLTVPQHIGTSQSHCPNYGGNSKPLNGRADTPMTFTIKFSATTEDGQAVTSVELVLIQDEKDEMRQEYMDMARLTTIRKGKVDGNVLRVPARSEFKGSDSYDDGHYSYMLNKGLAKKEQKWEEACKTYAETDLKRENVAAFNLFETGGYRNPHHHYYHVPLGKNSPRGWHQFGLALDVRTVDIDDNDTLENGKNGTSRLDGDRMEIAVKKYGGASWTSNNYSDGHVHAQWEWEGSNKERASTSSSGQFSLPPQGTDSPVSASPAPAPTPPAGSSNTGSNTDITYACGNHSGDSSASSSHSLQASCTSTDSNGNSCTVTSFYACDGHTHSYPSPPPPTTVSCSRSACTETVSSALEHRVGPCSACGGTYWSCGPNANWGQHYHRHRTCRFLTCRQTWRLCVDEKPDCLARSRQGQKCWSE